MQFKHSIHDGLLRGPVKVVVIGAGGTGSALLPRLMQLHFAMLALGHTSGLRVTVYDGDTVAQSNIGRQGFLPADIGLNKAIVLVNRLNMGWGTSWEAVPCELVETDELYADIVIGCVDTRRARATILDCIKSSHCYYLDSGNGEDSGQVLLGEVGNEALMAKHDRLPTVKDLFPELVDPELDTKDDRPSCSMADSLRKQSLFINMAMAVECSNLLWTLLRKGGLNYSGRFVNLESGTSAPIRIDRTVWKSMGYDAPPAPIPEAHTEPELQQ